MIQAETLLAPLERWWHDATTNIRIQARAGSPDVFLIEHHGKELLASHGIAIPAGLFVPAGGDVPADGVPAGPLMVKAQGAGGGRGKIGLVQHADSPAEATRVIARLSASSDRAIHGFRIERRIAFAHEAYISLSIDAASARTRLIVAEHGGIDVEQYGAHRSVLTLPEQLPGAARDLCAQLSQPMDRALGDAALHLADILLRLEATLIEINPLFVMADGTAVAGDVKLVIDDNAVPRQESIRALLERHPDIYPEAARKLAHGFDYIEVDVNGEIGLITTGAGLSMQLIDELKAQGRRPLNFCDIRSGQFRGDPARLIAVMRWIASRPTVRIVLVNIFAGITDLAEFAQLLVQAAAQVPQLRAPMVARLIGRNLDDARAILATSGLAVTLEPDLDRAIGLVLTALDGKDTRCG